MTTEKRAAIVIDDWKLPIFERHLSQAGYAFENVGQFFPGALALIIETENLIALSEVVKAAHDEARRTGAPS